jgi:hypothetical protein
MEPRIQLNCEARRQIQQPYGDVFGRRFPRWCHPNIWIVLSRVFEQLGRNYRANILSLGASKSGQSPDEALRCIVLMRSV